MTKDQLATATLDAVKARAIELESPLSDEDAAALGAMMMASAEVGKVTEKKFNSTMEQPRGGDFHTEGCPDAVDFRVPFSDQIFPCVPY